MAMILLNSGLSPDFSVPL